MNGGNGQGPQYSAFATGNSPGMGQTTMYGMPQAGMTPQNTYTTLQPGVQTPYQQPNWLSQSMWASNQPMQNANVQNYGRWGMSPTSGNTNGYGMGASPWPSPQSLFGNVPQGPAQNAQPNGQVPPPQPIGDNFNIGRTGGSLGSGGQLATMMQAKRQNMMATAAQLHDQNKQNIAAAQDPAQVQAAYQQFSGLQPTQQAQWLQNNPRMQAGMQNAGLLTPQTINYLRGGGLGIQY